MNEQEQPTIVHSHATTWHDGCVAILLPNGQIIDLAAERVGDRYKHSWNSGLAYQHLKEQFKGKEAEFGGANDHFVDPSNELEKSNHHLYHAASAFYASPFSQAAVLVVDGQGPDFGKRASTSIWKGDANTLSLIESPYLADGVFAPQSIGHFYTAIGALCGMQELHEEGKTMGLAPYGEPSKYQEFFRKYVFSYPDGSYYINPDFILAMLGNTLGPIQYGWQSQPPEIQTIWDEFIQLRGHNLRKKGEDVSKDDMNIAYAGQDILEEIMLGLAKRTRDLTGSNYLCLAGGVALNSVVNGKILRSGLFNDIYIFPAAGDDGQAIGKLLIDIKEQNLPVDTQIDTAYLGPTYDSERIKKAIEAFSTQVAHFELEDINLYREVAHRIALKQVVGWFNGGSEIGPRALGHRSILADPRDPGMREYINSQVKHREWYRPLAPVILEQLASEYFDLDRPSPFMLLVATVLAEKQDIIPAVTHVDGTARVQTIRKDQDERYYKLVEEFARQTGVPVLLNTSFNDKGEPIVETPEDALRSFLTMNLDALIIGNILILKKERLSQKTMVRIIVDETSQQGDMQRFLIEIRCGKKVLNFPGRFTEKEDYLRFNPLGQAQGNLPKELLQRPIEFAILPSDVKQHLHTWFGVLLGAYGNVNFERLHRLFPDMHNLD